MYNVGTLHGLFHADASFDIRKENRGVSNYVLYVANLSEVDRNLC